MNAEQIRKHVRREPFRPFRVYLSDRSYYDVPHPELIIVSNRDVAIATGATTPEQVPEELVYCDPRHITRIEPVDDASAATG